MKNIGWCNKWWWKKKNNKINKERERERERAKKKKKRQGMYKCRKQKDFESSSTPCCT